MRWLHAGIYEKKPIAVVSDASSPGVPACKWTPASEPWKVQLKKDNHLKGHSIVVIRSDSVGYWQHTQTHAVSLHFHFRCNKTSQKETHQNYWTWHPWIASAAYPMLTVYHWTNTLCGFETGILFNRTDKRSIQNMMCLCENTWIFQNLYVSE